MKNFKDLSGLVALPHSIFALPFALSAYLFAARQGRLVESALPLPVGFLLVILAVVSARTAAMSFNRIVDAEIDAKNPRTAGREIPAGRVRTDTAKRLAAGSIVVFLVCAWLLGWHCLVAAPFVLAVLLGYSVTKRFTRYSHLVLGLALALAPGGAWWVLRPGLEPAPVLLMLAVLLWVAGFDIIYSCQDVLFDRKQGLFSIPAEIGIERALHLSTLSHVVSLSCFLCVGQILSLGAYYWLGMGLFAVLLLGQHRLVRPHDFRRVNQAFFAANGVLSLFYFLLSTLLLTTN